jgi:hypothetical protein
MPVLTPRPAAVFDDGHHLRYRISHASS